MLLSSILQILNQHQLQLSTVEKKSKSETKEPFVIPKESSSPLDALNNEIAAAAGLLRPISVEPGQSPVALPGPNLDELLHIIEKFKEPIQSRVLDVFE
jgi:hypothetical protein